MKGFITIAFLFMVLQGLWHVESKIPERPSKIPPNLKEKIYHAKESIEKKLKDNVKQVVQHPSPKSPSFGKIDQPVKKQQGCEDIGQCSIDFSSCATNFEKYCECLPGFFNCIDSSKCKDKNAKQIIRQHMCASYGGICSKEAEDAGCDVSITAGPSIDWDEEEFTGKCLESMQKLQKQCISLDQQAEFPFDPKKMCQGNCLTNLNNVKRDCKGQLGEEAATFDILCDKDEKGKYCIDSLYQVFGLFDNQEDTLSEEQMDSLCGGCFKKILEATGEEKGNPFSTLFCMKHDGKYCINELLEDSELFGSEVCEDQILGCEVATLDSICKPGCARKIFAAASTFAEDEDRKLISSLLNWGCAKDGDEWCLVKYDRLVCTFSISFRFINFANASACVPDTINYLRKDCPAQSECKKSLEQLNTLGCCASSALGIVEAAADIDIKGALKTCDIELEGPCEVKRDKEIKKSIQVGVDYSWVKQNEDKARAALQKDLAGIAGVLPEDIEIELHEGPNGETVVTFSFHGFSDEETDILEKDITEVLETGNVFFPALEEESGMKVTFDSQFDDTSATYLTVPSILAIGLSLIPLFN